MLVHNRMTPKRRSAIQPTLGGGGGQRGTQTRFLEKNQTSKLGSDPGVQRNRPRVLDSQWHSFCAVKHSDASETARPNGGHNQRAVGLPWCHSLRCLLSLLSLLTSFPEPIRMRSCLFCTRSTTSLTLGTSSLAQLR